MEADGLLVIEGDTPLFGPGICNTCGRPGEHEACKRRVEELVRLCREKEAYMFRRYTVHRCKGAVTAELARSLAQAVATLQRYLNRDLDCDLAQAIEGDDWWYLPEGWIGMIGFIVEKRSQAIYPLGSGLAGRCREPHLYAYWCGILAYLDGIAEPV